MADRWINGRSFGYLLVGLVLGGAAATWFHRDDEPQTQDASTSLAAEESDTAKAEALDLDAALEAARQSLSTIQTRVDDYTAVLIKRQRIEGTLGDKQRIELKVQHLPPADDPKTMRVYLNFLEPDSLAGREVIWGSDLRDGKLYAHEGGLIGLIAVTLDPEGELAMRGQKHPVYRIGLANLAESFLENAEEMAAASEIRVSEGTRLVDDVECVNYVLAAVGSPVGVRLARVEFAIDPQRNIPLRYATYGQGTSSTKHPLEDLYEYHDVKLNVGLGDIDFDSENPDYNYP